MAKGKQPLPAHSTLDAVRANAPGHIFVPIAPTFQHRTVFCPENEERFNSLADDMEGNGWELVSVVPVQRHMSSANGSGFTRGWQCFWKRVKREEKP